MPFYGWEQTLCVLVNGFRVEYFSDTISALTERDYVVLQGNHAIMV